jgi:hypothetical protein
MPTISTISSLGTSVWKVPRLVDAGFRRTDTPPCFYRSQTLNKCPCVFQIACFTNACQPPRLVVGRNLSTRTTARPSACNSGVEKEQPTLYRTAASMAHNEATWRHTCPRRMAGAMRAGTHQSVAWPVLLAFSAVDSRNHKTGHGGIARSNRSAHAPEPWMPGDRYPACQRI